jgi:CHASE3 domain sensor protein
MKPTIRNKLLAGFGGVLLLLAVVAGIGIYSVFRLRHSAEDATRIGGQLNAVALEIQVHNLEAQRRIKVT